MRSSASTVERPALWWLWLAVLSPAEQAALDYSCAASTVWITRVGVLYALCQRLTQTATTQPSRHMVWYGEQACGRAYGLCVNAVVLRVPRRGE